MQITFFVGLIVYLFLGYLLCIDNNVFGDIDIKQSTKNDERSIKTLIS